MRAILLVGHGGVPRDCPRELISRLKALEGQRAARGGKPSDEERALDRRIRDWPRTPDTDPYQAGVERLAAALRARLGAIRVAVAYNEFCAPSLEEAVDRLIAGGATHITVVPTMLTPGGAHSELEIPAALAALRARHSGVALHYAWPFDVAPLADMLAAHLAR